MELNLFLVNNLVLFGTFVQKTIDPLILMIVGLVRFSQQIVFATQPDAIVTWIGVAVLRNF